MTIYEKIAQGVVDGDQIAVKELTQIAIKEEAELEKIIYAGLVKGMDVVATKWKNGDIFVPEVLIASRAMKAGMSIVTPLFEKNMNRKGIVVMGTVKGDVHDIGKNLVNLMMEAAGFKVIDLGTNVDKEIFLKTVRENNADILGISALLTTTMPYLKEIIAAFDGSGLRENVKIMIGGAPLTQKFADSIGADGYAENAPLAVEKAEELLASKMGKNGKSS